jgi:hypothetical protein
MFTYFSASKPYERLDFETDHPFRVVGRYIYRSFNMVHNIREYFRQTWYSRSYNYLLENEEDETKCLKDVLSKLPGKILLYNT